VDRLALMTSFVRAVETGSFSAVARELGTTQPNITRHIASLDAQVDSDPRRRALLR
jgi:LysR family transcriptional regulator for bpeEF and oprC